MKNIFDILSGFSITVPEEKKTEFETAFNDNYKTVAAFSFSANWSNVSASSPKKTSSISIKSIIGFLRKI